MITKKFKKDRIRAIIDSNRFGVEFSQEDVSEIGIITNTKFKRIRREINPSFPSDKRHIHVSDDGITWKPFSWVKSVDGKSDDVNAAMRYAIKDDLDEFRRISPKRCVTCGTEKFLQTDHVDPPFKKIKEEF